MASTCFLPVVAATASVRHWPRWWRNSRIECCRWDRPEAAQAATLRAQAHRSGRVLDLGDALIAGTAMANALSVATRNVGDFESLGLNVVNPWEYLAKYR